MTLTRRDFLKTGAAAAAVTIMPRPLLLRLGRTPEPMPPIEDPRLKELALRGIDTARSTGATYADVRLCHTRTRTIYAEQVPNSVFDDEELDVGVRTLVDGYWGFASGPIWSPDEMVRLAREAIHQARVVALGEARPVELAPVPAVADGHWVMPIERDPFDVSPFEIQDFLESLQLYTENLPGRGEKKSSVVATFVVQSKAFASTDGSYCTQQLYRSGAGLRVTYTEDRGGARGRRGDRRMEPLTPAGLGWELFTADRIPRVRDGSLREEIRRRIEEIKEDLTLPIKPVEVGRYDTVLDAVSVQTILDGTIGRATELDRALGYEANAGGTSYLTAPFDMLESYHAGAPTLTVTADREQPGGAATVQWDDEGVVPDECTLVKDGVLADFQTTREGAGWLHASYAKLGRPFRSHGFANAPSAVDPQMQHTPNLVLTPGHEAHDFDSFVAGMTNGIAIRGLNLDMDFQHSSGFGMGNTYEVKHGKRVARIAGAGVLFRATELWKSLAALGGEASVRRYGYDAAKGEPAQRCFHSVSAPPAVVKDLTLIDVMRKA